MNFLHKIKLINITAQAKNIVVIRLASGPKSPPVNKSVPDIFDIRKELVLLCSPLILKPNIFPSAKFQPKCNPQTPHILPALIAYKAKKKPDKVKFINDRTVAPLLNK